MHVIVEYSVLLLIFSHRYYYSIFCQYKYGVGIPDYAQTTCTIATFGTSKFTICMHALLYNLCYPVTLHKCCITTALNSL